MSQEVAGSRPLSEVINVHLSRGVPNVEDLALDKVRTGATCEQDLACFTILVLQ